ncbi:MAG TPA: thioredoxin family protein [Candidatus Hydrogenedentes bacterium]|nr:thioredoxin family protein [Candidatus Hydrogenedentota bacterium]
MTIIICVGIGVGLGALLGSTRSCEDGACPLTANPRRGALSGAFLGLLFGGALAGGGLGAAPGVAGGVSAPNEVVQLAPGAVAEEGKTIVYFYADWCAVCRQFKPTLGKVLSSSGDGIAFSQVNVDAMPKVAKQHEVRYLPTTILFENGIERRRFVGAVSEGELNAALS